MVGGVAQGIRRLSEGVHARHSLRRLLILVSVCELLLEAGGDILQELPSRVPSMIDRALTVRVIAPTNIVVILN